MLRYVQGVRARLADVAPHLAKTDDVEPALWLNGATYAHVPAKSVKVGLGKLNTADP
jgi:hypothetical protein